MLTFDPAIEPSSREISDLLHKLINDSAPVRIALTVGGTPSMCATVTGKLRITADGTIWVVNEDRFAEARITFKPSLAIERRFGGHPPFRRDPETSFDASAKFPSTVTLIFADRSQVSLVELSRNS